MINNLSDEQTNDLLRTARITRLGCIVDGEPYVVPIYYDFEEGAINGHPLPSLKIDALRENPRGGVRVDQIETDLHWKSG